MPGAAVFRCPGIVDGDERFQGEKIRRAPRGKNVARADRGNLYRRVDVARPVLL